MTDDVVVNVLLWSFLLVAAGCLIWAHRRRTQLLYTIDSKPMFPAGANASLTIDGAEINHPHMVRIDVEPLGEKDIRGGDFADGTGLQFDLGAVLVADLDSTDGSLAVQGNQGDRHVAITPQLLKCRETVGQSFIVEGPPLASTKGTVDVRKRRVAATLTGSH